MVESTQDQDHQEDEDKTFLEQPDILDKLKAAALITDAALAKAVELAIPGADIYAICQTVDSFIEEEVKKVFASKKSKGLERGIAFPTCISVNHIMGHYSPLEDESTQLAEGDMAKIVCGAHIDGFPANAATTCIVGSGSLEGSQADVMLAAWTAFQAAQRVIKEAATNNEVTEAIAKACAAYECQPVEGVLSHKVKKHLIDGNDVIINKETPSQQVDEFQFAPGDVIGLDIYVSTGEGVPKEAEERPTVFKRELSTVYNLKSKSARAFFVEVNKRFPTLPFSIRACEDKIAAKVGVKECFEHDLMMPYPVLTEKPGDFVAQFKATVAVLPRSTVVLCGGAAVDTSKFKSNKEVTDEDLKTLLAQNLWTKAKGKGKK